VGINALFSPKFGALTGPRYPLDPNMPAGDRINCFLPGTKIEGEFVKAMRSIYHGKAVEIVTDNGNILRVTGKHPVFTEQGLIFADSIEEGNNLISYKGDIKRPIDDGFNPFAIFPSNKNNSPSSIEQVFGTLSEIAFNESRGANSADFHGDGQFIKGDIKIVGANRELLMDVESLRPKMVGKLSLKFEDFILSFECSVGTSNFDGAVINHSSSGIPSVGALAFDEFSIFFNRFPFEGFAFRLSPEFDSTLNKVSVDGGSGSVEHFGKGFDALSTFIKGDNPFRVPINVIVSTMVVGRSSFDFSSIDNFIENGGRDRIFVHDFLNRHSGNILLDNVISINHFDYSGFVYDVESPYGWLIADNLLVSNCRCSMIFEIRQ